jgi:hypothetical protein
MVKDTQQGKSVNRQALRTQQLAYFLPALILGSLSWALTGNWRVLIFLVVFLLVIWEASFFIKAGFSPRYYYGKLAYRQQEKYFTPKDFQLVSLPRKILADAKSLEISSSEAIHRWRWRQVDQIGLTPNFIFIHVENWPVAYVPKRDFPSEQSFIDFGRNLVEFKRKEQRSANRCRIMQSSKTTTQQSVHTFATLRQVGFAAILEHFAQRDFEFILLPGRVHPSPAHHYPA